MLILNETEEDMSMLKHVLQIKVCCYLAKEISIKASFFSLIFIIL